MRRTYKFRAYPTGPQEVRAVRLLRDHCDLYNAALQERRDAWRHVSKTTVRYGDQSAQLKEIRRVDPTGQGRHSFTAQQQTLRRVDTVMGSFFARVKTGKAGYPRFKPHNRFDQVVFVDRDGAKWSPAEPGARWAFARFQAVGTVKVRQHRPVRGTVKTLQLKREHRRWYVIVVVDVEPEPLPAAGHTVGVDVGVARFLTTSDGQVVDNPRFLAAAAGDIAELQRRKARSRRGSGNTRRLRQALAKRWRKVRHQRHDFHHKTARALVDAYDVLAVETLNVAGMTRAPQPRPDGTGGYLPNGAAAKAGLNKSILDAGWTRFANTLVAKAEEAGRRVVFVNPAYTSIDCHRCGTRCTRPRQDTVICPRCGPIDADLNGAHNVHTRAGLGSGHTAPAA
ncbi:RNA-guided endonuclease InsQ/TnpB family protein [Saccharothrix obliqua]|uniref:RNA-guided endonuclease InsQ/TnpB family protein n=1 Tax=Saccharothrix obliqua TaxID=2861747 RepID=UPI001C5EE41E|nr:RNA-guided endonuclease TnpB family protein [Saccharothrix obliqua]MBW4717812.1 transposase [Saccharothrix obliqua]